MSVEVSVDAVIRTPSLNLWPGDSVMIWFLSNGAEMSVELRFSDTGVPVIRIIAGRNDYNLVEEKK